MKFGYTIVYVPDVPASLKFFNDAFGITMRFLHESNTYGELETGETALMFAGHALRDSNFRDGFVRADTSEKPLGIEIALVTENVGIAHGRATFAGAREISAPTLKRWGETVSNVRCPDGKLVELCTPIVL